VFSLDIRTGSSSFIFLFSIQEILADYKVGGVCSHGKWHAQILVVSAFRFRFYAVLFFKVASGGAVSPAGEFLFAFAQKGTKNATQGYRPKNPLLPWV